MRVVSFSNLGPFGPRRGIESRRWRGGAATRQHAEITHRSNLIFTSFTMGLFCCVVAEFSYWQYFGTYIWFVIIGLRPLGQFLCAIVEEQLQEALLVMPVMTAFDMTCGVITLSCDDFVDFMVLTQCVELELELDVVAAMASS